MKKYLFPAILVVVVGGMIALFMAGQKQPSANTQNPTTSNLPETHYTELARTHIAEGTTTPVPYNSNPPSSGPHYPSPAAWGIVDPSKVEADERYVHNLEHGGIWITYKPDLPQQDIDRLKSLAQNLPQDGQFGEVKVVLSPRAANDRPISVVAWAYVMNLDSVDGALIRQFYLNHVNKGPEVIP